MCCWLGTENKDWCDQRLQEKRVVLLLAWTKEEGELVKVVSLFFFILETVIAEKRKDIQGQFLTPAQTLDGLKQDLDIWHAAHHNKIFHLVHHPFETD